MFARKNTFSRFKDYSVNSDSVFNYFKEIEAEEDFQNNEESEDILN